MGSLQAGIFFLGSVKTADATAAHVALQTIWSMVFHWPNNRKNGSIVPGGSSKVSVGNCARTHGSSYIPYSFTCGYVNAVQFPTSGDWLACCVQCWRRRVFRRQCGRWSHRMGSCLGRVSRKGIELQSNVEESGSHAMLDF